jgi:hypothetical protein
MAFSAEEFLRAVETALGPGLYEFFDNELHTYIALREEKKLLLAEKVSSMISLICFTLSFLSSVSFCTNLRSYVPSSYRSR